MEPQLIADYSCEVGEGPIWNALDRQLYWTDIPPGKLFRFNPSTGKHEQFFKGPMIGGMTVQADGALLLFSEKGAVIEWRSGSTRYLIDSIPGEEANRFNDVIADPAGRVFCGTMPIDSSKGDKRLGRLFRLDTNGSITPVLEKIGISNGMGFTPDRKGMYYIDTIDHAVSFFDYDQQSGKLSNRRVFVDLSKEKGSPDGMTVDARGYVWVAIWGGNAVIRFSPKGIEERRVRLPVEQVSCLTFGGEKYTDIYITTAGGHEKQKNGPIAGALFKVNLGIKGVPEFFSRVGLA